MLSCLVGVLVPRLLSYHCPDLLRSADFKISGSPLRHTIPLLLDMDCLGLERVAIACNSCSARSWMVCDMFLCLQLVHPSKYKPGWLAIMV